MRTEEHFSAGGVVYRVDGNQVDVILCGRDRPPSWGLPKGTPDPGETVEETALREVREETGLDVDLEDDLGQIEYWFSKPGARVHKRVRFFLMRATGGDTASHDPEFDFVEWLPGEEALRRATYPSEQEILKRALVKVKQP